MTAQACIYNPNPSMTGSKVLDTFKQVRSYKGKGGGESGATGMVVDIGVAKIEFNFMTSSDVADHLNGFMGFAQSCIKNKDKLVYTLGRIHDVKLVMGCVIEPGFDKDKVVQGFLLEYVNRLNGLLFVNNMILDYDGEVLNKE